MNLFYKYRGLKESKDSLFFKDAFVDGFGVKLPSNVGFRKGNVTAEMDSLGFVKELKLEIFNVHSLNEIISRSTKKTVLNKSEKVFTIKNQIDLPPLSLIYVYHLSFKPDSLSDKQRISDYGIYKRIK